MLTIVCTQGIADGTGSHVAIASYMREMRRRGHRVVFVCGRVPITADAPGASVMKELSDVGIELVFDSGIGLVYSASTSRRLAAILRDREANVVVTSTQLDGKYALRASALAGIPCVVFAQNQYKFWGNVLVRSLKRRWY